MFLRGRKRSQEGTGKLLKKPKSLLRNLLTHFCQCCCCIHFQNFVPSPRIVHPTRLVLEFLTLFTIDFQLFRVWGGSSSITGSASVNAPVLVTNRRDAQEVGPGPRLRCCDAGLCSDNIAMKIPSDLEWHVTLGDNTWDMDKVTFISHLLAKGKRKNLRRFCKKDQREHNWSVT